MDEESSKHENSDNLSKKTSPQNSDSTSDTTKSEEENFTTNTSPNELTPSEILSLHGTIELDEGDEVDLKEHFKTCTKDPGHRKFIPVKDFTMKDLPESHQDTDLYDVIKATADLTIRLCIQKTSPQRPEFWPGSKVPYPFHHKRGLENKTTGTGDVAVIKFTDGQGCSGYRRTTFVITGKNIESEYKTCPCGKCVESDKPNNIWWEIYVTTATHVVFDQYEASHTSGRLFYDSADSPLVKLDKFKIVSVDPKRDKCQMKYVTCEDFGRQLYEMTVHRCDLWEKVSEKFFNRSDVIIIVSHPHGCSKHISIGHLKKHYKVFEFNTKWDITKLSYTTGTCRGSSGAKVYFVGSRASHVHTGCLADGFNYSCASYSLRN